jgi:Flp pilus assembly protein TadG
MTMVLVAIAMVAIIAMAALSIDIVTLYLAREEAQRSADVAALGAARVLSLSGVTGDPQNTTGYWTAACNAATQAAQALASQNSVGSATATSVNVNFLYNGTAVANCTFAGLNAFGVNPQVQVQVIRTGLPTFFARIWSRNTNSVSATATAEAFNSSGSGAFAPNGIIPVNPRCVKPWIIPNEDSGNRGNTFVSLSDGSITNPGIRVNGAGTGVIGEPLTLTSACGGGRRGRGCTLLSNPPPMGSYIPAAVVTPVSAYPICADGSTFQEAIGGCDQNTQYACGVSGGASADLTINPARDTRTAAECLINNAGPDSLDTSSFPYLVQAGRANPVITSGVVTSSTSIATVPIYDSTLPLQSTNNPTITIVGFLQVFINQANPNGSLSVTVLNVAGCSNTATNPPIPASGTSPVPIRLITQQ